MKAEQLRKSILQLAIQGKLVPQEPDDEPASVLLERIRVEKQKLIKEGKIKKDKNDSVIFKGDDNRYYEKVGSEVKDITDDLPFEIPDSWVFVRLSTVCWLGDVAKSVGEKLPYLDAKTLRGKSDKTYLSEGKVVDVGEKVILVDGENSGEVFDIPFRGYMGSTFKTLETVSHFNFAYLNVVLDYYRDTFRGNKIGAAIPHLNKNLFKSLLIGIPPLAEQSRIVFEIEKYEPLIAEYDKLEQQATKLDEEIYDKLKKSILQYAIQGKLVPQDPNDEPASVLLERIRAEKKAKLGKKYVDSYIYKGDDNCYYEKVGRNEPVRLEDLPFEIPDSWCWARLKDVAFNHGQKIPNIAFSYIDIGSIDNVNQKLSAKENIVEPEKAPSRARKIVERGDVLYATVRPYLHNMCVVEKDFSLEPIASTGFAVLAVERGIKNTFLFYYMLSPVFDQYANSSENSKGVAYPAINDEKLYKAPIPIPPQNEQQNICKLIDKCFNVLMLKDEG